MALLELTVHTARPGHLDAVLELARGHWHPAMQRSGAAPLFLARGLSGTLNELTCAWVHDSALAHAQAHERLAGDAAWHEGVRRARPHLLREQAETVRTTAFTQVAPLPAHSGVIDLRCYSFHPGALEEFLPLCEQHGLPRQRAACGQLLFHGTSASGRLHRLVQAWAYPDVAAYEEGQRRLFADAHWVQGYRARVLPLVQEQEHQLLATWPPQPRSPH